MYQMMRFLCTFFIFVLVNRDEMLISSINQHDWHSVIANSNLLTLKYLITAVLN